jgi:hypothetical protein
MVDLPAMIVQLRRRLRDAPLAVTIAINGVLAGEFDKGVTTG